MRNLVCCMVFLVCGHLALAQGGSALLRNGSFEGGSGSDGRGGGVPEWEPFEAGYAVDREQHQVGDQSIRCESIGPMARRGAMTRLLLNQKRPIPLLITGWSKADRVSGVRNGDYALYVDLEYTDGTPLWGQVAPFSVGTHDWERRQVMILPTKPIKTLTLYALFRHHVGTAWFDNFTVTALEGAGLFDSQAMPGFPRRSGKARAYQIRGRDGLALDLDKQGDILGVRAGALEIASATAGGLFVRDVTADGPLVPLRGVVRPYKNGLLVLGTVNPMRLRFTAKLLPEGDAIGVDGELTDLSKTERAITVYLVLPVRGDGWNWGQDIRAAETIEPNREYTNQVRVSVGATGGLSLYPFGCVSNARAGVGIASQMDWPSVHRIFYSGSRRALVMAWDMALTRKTAAWPPHNVRFRCTLFRLPTEQAEWGFRAAALRFYQLHTRDFTRRAKAEGIWIPFTDPKTVERAEDFGFAYHEGDNSLKTDDATGILSFRYTEPMTYWMPMPPAMPRTYEAALELLKYNAGLAMTRPAEAKEPTKEARDFSRAVLNSGTEASDGKFNVEFQNQPWANGAVFLLNPNPELSATPDKPTKASLSYTVEKAAQMYGEEAKRTRGDQDGEYLDSLEMWADMQDYRPSHLLACPYPLTFDTDNRRPTLPQWYSTYAFARYLRDDLHNRGKLLMANTTPVRFTIFAPLMDVMGIETNWLWTDGSWHPDDDATFNLRRTMSYRKPYLLLQNTNFDNFTSPMVEKYFQRSLFYGVYPGMFSVDAANNPYWETPRWYNRDRPLFVKYIPIIKRLSAAGWQPITQARSSNRGLYVERFGQRLFTAFNDTKDTQSGELTIDLRALGIAAPKLRVVNLLTNNEVPSERSGERLTVSLSLKPEEAAALEIQQATP